MVVSSVTSLDAQQYVIALHGFIAQLKDSWSGVN